MKKRARKTPPDADGNVRLLIWCPGCCYAHVACVEGPGKKHDWNGSLERPTLTPSLLIRGSELVSASLAQKPLIDCHSHVRDGLITFEADCGHDLAGQTHELVADL